ncbi:ead/Ea22-like family protein [Citrobacter amalonaticus]|uniref:ead/Ea22-like family protein n=1 Tax=Citrobacter amalonaticus TaxID=35703 RepID=UPI001889F715|nr:ead/Ea22-like family protein [Citrobacter amalonaticus]QPB30593.1 ead/Ea22-like family protein [Citrobacter amalonaticus]HDT0316010.1 ead/Ea22-like family protein [Citrobacter amalonaticus]
MSNIDKRALREAAEKATPGNWWIDSHGQAMVSFIDNDVLEVFATDNKRAAVRHEDTGNLSRWRNDNDATFIATADPATVLALLDELEAAEKTSTARLEAIDRTHQMFQRERNRVEAAEKRIAELEARTVKLPEPISVLHRRDFNDAHRAIYAYPEAVVDAALAAAGIGKGE